MNALIYCNNVSYSSKKTSEKKKSAQLIPRPCCLFNVENKWNSLQKRVYFCCTHVSLSILPNLRNRVLECVLNFPGGFQRNSKAVCQLTGTNSKLFTHHNLSRAKSWKLSFGVVNHSMDQTSRNFCSCLCSKELVQKNRALGNMRRIFCRNITSSKHSGYPPDCSCRWSSIRPLPATFPARTAVT